MKKTRFERFMLAVTKKALNEESLDTYRDHLKFVRISIELELLKFGGSEKIPAKTEERVQSRGDQVLGALGTIKGGLKTLGSTSKKAYAFLGTGNNFVIVVIGLIMVYAGIMVALGMV